MKELSKIMVNSDQLKMLIGQSIPDSLHYKLLGKKAYLSTEKLDLVRYSLQALINAKHYKRLKSLHPDFDNKEPIKLSVDRIRENGLSYDLRDRIFNSKRCIKRGNICGQFYFLRQLLNADQIHEIRENLVKMANTTQLELL